MNHCCICLSLGAIKSIRADAVAHKMLHVHGIFIPSVQSPKQPQRLLDREVFLERLLLCLVLSSQERQR